MGKKRCHSAEIERVGIIDVQPVIGLLSLSLSLPPTLYIVYMSCAHVPHMYVSRITYHNHCHLFVITGVLVHDMYTGPGIHVKIL